MDKKEPSKHVDDDNDQRRRQKRSPSLFHSIINLSPLGGKSTSHPENSPISHNDAINMAKKNRKKMSEKKPLPGTSIGGVNTSGHPGPRTFSILTALNELSISDNAQPHQHPQHTKNTNTVTSSCRTDEILALQHQISTSTTNPRRIANGEATKQRKCRFTQVPHDGTFFSVPLTNSSSLNPPPPQPRQSFDQVERRRKYHQHQDGCDGGGKSWSKSHLSLLPQCQEEQVKNLNNFPLVVENEGIKSYLRSSRENVTKPPDWIQAIFQQTKCGRLDKLIQLLHGLDSSVIRHLVDARGRNLLHCAAGGGQLNAVQWLLSTLGPTLGDAALKDRDQSGRTPVLRALKKKRLNCFKWMVLQRGGLPPEEASPLLHYAARDGNLRAVRWLVGIFKERQISLDLKDPSSGMTPLCEAAAAGKSVVCHELIRNGANPLYQTDFGWRPMDFATSQNQLESANYLMMAATAAELGTALDKRLQEFQALTEDYDSLRYHFRELLRIGKWLAKERTDLIKNSGTGKCGSEAFQHLLLGTGSGTRFSDLEHKLGQAEEASRKLLLEKGNTFGSSTTTTAMDPVIANGNAFNLLDMIAAAEMRCETMLRNGEPTAIQDEDNGGGESSSSCSTSASCDEEDDDDDEPTSKLGFDTNQNKFQRQSWMAVGGGMSTSMSTKKSPSRTTYMPNWDKSNLAPWLLPSPSQGPQEFIDTSQLSPSPLIRQLDLLENPPKSRTSGPTPPSSFTLHSQGYNMGGRVSIGNSTTGSSLGMPQPPSTIFTHHEDAKSMDVVVEEELLPTKPALLEVIEPPNLVSIKGPPDLIRETTRGSGSGGSGSNSIHLNLNKENWCGTKKEEGIDDTIYSEITSSSTRLCLKRDSTSEFVKKSPQSSIISNFSPSNKCQNHQSCCDMDVVDASPHPSSSPSKEQMYLDLDSRNSMSNSSDDGRILEKSSSLSKTSGRNASYSNRLHQVEDYQLHTFSTFLKLKSENNNDKCSSGGGGGSTLIDSSSSTTFPVQVSTQFPRNVFQILENGSQKDISSENSSGKVCLPGEKSSLASKTPVHHLFSTSTTLLPPGESNTGSWELMNPPESGINMDDVGPPGSPCPSENSRTESALFLHDPPPPPPASNTSQGSRTESAREQGLTLDEEHNHDNHTDLETVDRNEIDIGPESLDREKGAYLRHHDDDYDVDRDEPLPPPESQDSKNKVDVSVEKRTGGGPFVVSTRIHKPSNTHYVTKNGRRQRKAWYDEDGSDQEEETFLRKMQPTSPTN